MRRRPTALTSSRSFSLNLDVYLWLILISSSLTYGCDSDQSSDSGVIVIAQSPEEESMIADASTSEEVTSDQGVEEPSEDVQLTIKAINPLNSSGLSGLSATWPEALDLRPRADTLTDDSGSITFDLPSQSEYEVILSGEGYSAHHLFGALGDQNATQISFVSTDQLTQQVFTALGIQPSMDKGIVVIGLDRPNLAPAVGASAELESPYEKVFTLGQFGPSEGSSVIAGGGGFVSFANVEPGDIRVFVQAPENQRCALFPRDDWSQEISAEEPNFILPVYAGEVSIVAFTCKDDL